MSNRFYYWDGLTKLSESLTGRENIMIGCRPYGFHAGNMLAMLIYPYLLAKVLREKLACEPQFIFEVNFNDLELKNPEYHPLSYSLVNREKTTFQNTPDPLHCCESLSEHWQSIIKNHYNIFKRDFPSIHINFMSTGMCQWK